MKALILSLLLINVSYAYDYKIKDNYRRTTGYANKDKGTYQEYNKFGRKTRSIDSNGVIKDNYGRKTGKVDKK